MRMRGHRLRSGVKRAGNRAGSPALMLAVTMPIHSARPISTAASAHMRRQSTLPCCCTHFGPSLRCHFQMAPGRSLTAGNNVALSLAWSATP